MTVEERAPAPSRSAIPAIRTTSGPRSTTTAASSTARPTSRATPTNGPTVTLASDHRRDVQHRHLQRVGPGEERDHDRRACTRSTDVDAAADRRTTYVPLDHLPERVPDRDDDLPGFDHKGQIWVNRLCGQGGGYSHIMTPNLKACFFRARHRRRQYRTMVGASSYHSGGVNVGFLDGSVRFIKDSVTQQTWWGIATKAGGDSELDESPESSLARPPSSNVF